ncbi:MAG: CotH kinase family protein [Kiritimatiellae bacterium]|nr:CotH kinase family protein [Kiritimatiellia bacterium]
MTALIQTRVAALSLLVFSMFACAAAQAENVEPAFAWTPGSNPTGSWFTSWSGSSETPYASGVEPLGDAFTFITYGSADSVKADAGKYAVLWCMGRQVAKTDAGWTDADNNKTVLVKDEDGNILLTQMYGTDTTTLKTVSAGVVSGDHLFTVRFSKTGGASLQIDDGEVCANGEMTTPPGKGFQVRALYGGATDPYASGAGFEVIKMLAYKTSDLPAAQYAEIVRTKAYTVEPPAPTFDPATDEVATEAVLRISEIMPKPTDDQNPGLREGMDVNGLESGWVEVENTSSDKWADLADYKFTRTNRGKKTGQADYGNFPSVMIAPGGRFVFYTSERYANSADAAVSAFAEGTFDGKPMIMDDDLHGILVWGDKVNPKKSPFVRLMHTPTGTIVETVVIPSDVPEGYSIIVGETQANTATARWLCPTPTRGTANTATAGLVRLGPNAGPLYEISSQKKHDSASEFARIAPPAVPGTDYKITFSFNPVMHPTQAAAFRDEDRLTAIRLIYRTDLDDKTLKTRTVDFATKTTDANDWGDTFVATISAGDLPAAGHLVQWKFIATDASGNEWTSPSFHNSDDGYEWYGTIVEPSAGQMSATLPTWHLFAAGDHLTQMDVDADKQDRSKVPNQARVAIYDSSTSNYYDYVRIDLRGNTSAKFTKKSHGLRFAKAHPLTMKDIVSGETIEEIRKTSLISEFADPSFMRQMMSFWLWRKMGNLVPFDFPVRCNLNGEFYQLAFNSERFTDELIEDIYGLDKFGYSYKNVGTMKSDSGTTAGGIEKKTPDDEDESNITVLQSTLRQPLKDYGAQSGKEDVAALTKFVVQKFNLPAWLNYLASARITQEMDDVWANVCAYYDNAEMKDGVRGTDTWMPLGYDFNLSLGQYYRDSGVGGYGLFATNDWFKSHPFYGGNRVRCYSSATMSSVINSGNDGFEAVWQSAKFRRLYLRRLRTLMDQELKEPGTRETEVPFMVKMREMADLMRADSKLDLAKWKDDVSDDSIDVWRFTTRPADIDAGVDDIWDNYVVPRRTHLYVTHSATNTAKAIGYGSNLNAGIPEAQSPIAALAPNITLDFSRQAEGVVVVSNANDEVVDMSGWTLRFGVEWTLPAGTVCDAHDGIYIVADRRAYIAAHADELTDQVIVGNADFSALAPVVLNAGDGTCLHGLSSADGVLTFAAKNDKAAAAVVETVAPELTAEDRKAGLDAKYLTVVAQPVAGQDKTYRAVVAVNPKTVGAPQFVAAGDDPPVAVAADDAGKTVVSSTIGNAVKGLWYGYEVADELDESAAFTNDADSFRPAAGPSHTVTSSPRDRSEKPSGFFRVKVLPAKP